MAGRRHREVKVYLQEQKVSVLLCHFALPQTLKIYMFINIFSQAKDLIWLKMMQAII
jgi:hypothetical protein